MYTKKNNIVYKDGNEIANFQEYLEFLEFYYKIGKQDDYKKVFEYSDALNLRDKFSPIKSLTKTEPFERRIQRGNMLFRNSNDMQRATLDFDVIVNTPKGQKPLQRGLVWTLLQKQSLIETKLKGIKIPPMSVCIFENKKGEKIHQIIDGKQRLTTILAFINNEFPIIVNDVEYFYKNFDRITAFEFDREIHADVFYSYEDAKSEKSSEFFLADADKIAWFKKINFAGTPQDLEHLKDFE